MLRCLDFANSMHYQLALALPSFVAFRQRLEIICHRDVIKA